MWEKTFSDPGVNLGQVNAQRDFAATGDRVVETQTFDETAIAGGAAVGHGDVIERTFLSATAGETNNYHNSITLFQSGFPARGARRRPSYPLENPPGAVKQARSGREGCGLYAHPRPR